MTDRNCKTCACYAEVTLSPMAPAQSQCRRNGPIPAQVRIERPRMLDHKPVIGKDGKPVTEISVENVFLYAPTRSDMVCWDGWRPIGTPPGYPYLRVSSRELETTEEYLARQKKEHLDVMGSTG